jgi:crossover junction endodeoxyribonuclease RuvC
MGERVLGVDPGTLQMGYGLLETGYPEAKCLTWGALTASRSRPIGERLLSFQGGLQKILEEWNPQVIAVEQPYIPRRDTSVRSAIAVGQAQAVALMVAAWAGVPVFSYTPAQVKQTVTEYGRSPKEQVQEMVRVLLHLDLVPQPTDASDALAVALCHLQQQHVRRLLEEGVAKGLGIVRPRRIEP